MQLQTLQRRNLAYHWRMNLAVGMGVVVATAALAGALLVGDSMRASLRETAVARLAGTDFSLQSPRLFDESLADRIAESDALNDTAPALLLSGSAQHADSGAYVERVNVIGVDDRFWRFTGAGDVADFDALVLNQSLARQLGAETGDDVLLRVQKPEDVSTETLLGRRDRTIVSTRRTVGNVIADRGPGGFSLKQQQQAPYNAFVSLSRLQRIIDQLSQVNTLLMAGAGDNDLSLLQQSLREAWRLEDVGLRVRTDTDGSMLLLESDRFLLEPAVEVAVRTSTDDLQWPVGSVLTYLANEIRFDASAGLRVTPYSTVAAVDRSLIEQAAMRKLDGSSLEGIESGAIVLNEWTADDLGVSVGDEVTITYDVTGEYGTLETIARTLKVSAIVALSGGAADPRLTPEYEGVTDTDSIADWDPPFPMDLDRVREKDEDYWKDHRATPKAFISLEDGQAFWAEDAERFGRLTAMRVVPPGDTDVQDSAAQFERGVLEHLDPDAMGLAIQPVRERAIAAGGGSTDFGGLFIGFSFFLIFAAAMLVALLFRLGVERRSHEIGLLLAIGYAPKRVARFLLIDGAWVAVLGSLVGLVGAVGYAWLMLAGLRTWWSDAANAPFLRLHVGSTSLAIGLLAGVMVALLSVAWSIRGLTRLSVRALLAGDVQTSPHGATGKSSRSRMVAVGAALAVPIPAFVAGQSDAMTDAIAFFLCGSLLLVAAIAATNDLLRRKQPALAGRHGRGAMIGLGLRNAPREAKRSLLTIGLIASATFVVASLSAFRLDVSPDTSEVFSGTGGFALMAESSVPLQFNLNTDEGRERLNLSGDDSALGRMAVFAFRLRPGEESGCLNLYKPKNPRILGATRPMINRGGFAFSGTLAETDLERENPWTLLNKTFPDGAIPAIGDEAAVKWQLHAGLGKDFAIADERGREVRLRFVALLKGSALQDELIVSDDRFTELFPSISGHGFFLIEPRNDEGDPIALATTLERGLSDFGFDAWTTTERMAGYFAVQNTYLSTFQTLGGLGLVLGTLGLTAVMLRNVWERRAELALMRALGFSRESLAWMVLSENGVLVLSGLAAGALPAMLAVSPQIMRDPSSLNIPAIGATLVGVFVTGTLAGAVALWPTLRAPLLSALRSE